MFNIRYIKAEPTTFLMKYKNGKLKRKGSGLSLWYYAPTTSLVAIPIGTIDLPFIFKELTRDFQEVTVQGQLVYRISEPEQLASLMNFTLDRDGKKFVSEDPEKLNNRIISLVQVKMRTAIEQLDLRKTLTSSQNLVVTIKDQLIKSEVLLSLGIEVMDLAIIAIKPTPETARALEATVREELLQEADNAIYVRRNASIELEREVKENELNTELAIEEKQQEIREKQLKAERLLQTQRSEIMREKLEADIAQEDKRKELVELASQNERKEIDVKSYEIASNMEALSKVDARVLEALTIANLGPQQLVAQAFKELAGGADKIGELNIAPDLLKAIAGRTQA